MIQATASGRLDVMGGVADYSGSLLLQMPIRESTTVTLKPREDGMLRVQSDVMRQEYSMQVLDFYQDGQWISTEVLRPKITSREGGEWAIYVVGCVFALLEKYDLPAQGFDIHLASDVPLGKGVSSSASLEVATLKALTAYYNVSLPDLQLPILAQYVENEIVGAPCGLMDQLASYFGKPRHLLPIICQPASIHEPIPIPEHVHFIGIDSGVRHAVSGNPYREARVAAFMGYSYIAQSLGIEKELLLRKKAGEALANLPFNGYLSNIGLPLLWTDFQKILPEKMLGRTFIETFGDTIDPVTTVDPDVEYAVKACTQFPIWTNYCVQTFQKLLEGWNIVEDKPLILRMLGRFMTSLNKGYSSMGLGSDRTDALVKALMDVGQKGGIYGARITGGGSGGTVCAVCYGDEGKANALQVATDFSQQYDYPKCVFES
jgi:L-arabinokinase